MIATLSGTLFIKQPDHVVIDVGGVGYEVLVSAKTYDTLPETGEEAFLYIYTSVREDAIILFGFGQVEEKELFLLLNSVSGVGPKLALGILSGISAAELGQALSTRNMARLTALPGVGKKTAERLCLELQDKAGRFYVPGEGAERVTAEETLVEDDNVQDALSALANLGYPRSQAWKALRRVQKEHVDGLAGMKIEELIREALRELA